MEVLKAVSIAMVTKILAEVLLAVALLRRAMRTMDVALTSTQATATKAVLGAVTPKQFLQVAT